ncbi:hypothetical protein T484DRAFT_1837067, partial [Baffinella frigidus]
MRGASMQALLLLAAGTVLCSAEASGPAGVGARPLARMGLECSAPGAALELRAAGAVGAPAAAGLGSFARLEGAGVLAQLRLRGGAKSKNHTNHNQNRKAHRNGIKRIQT